MNREVQVRICEGLGVKLPGPTRRTSPFAVTRGRSGIGALPPFTGTRAKDPLPPSCGVPVGRHEGQLWVTGGKTRSENMFSELLQLADIVRSAFHYSANLLVLQITAFWVRAIPR